MFQMKHQQDVTPTLTVFPSNREGGFGLAMLPDSIPLSADGTLVGASQHLVRGYGIWRTVAHLGVAVKAAGLALWLRFMGLETKTVDSR